MDPVAIKKRGVFQRQFLCLLLYKLILNPFNVGIFIALSPPILHRLQSVLILHLQDYCGFHQGMNIVDILFQIFICLFMRKNQMRRLTLFRNNCVFLIFGVYSLFFRRGARSRTNSVNRQLLKEQISPKCVN